jgi:hypothetical protein
VIEFGFFIFGLVVGIVFTLSVFFLRANAPTNEVMPERKPSVALPFNKSKPVRNKPKVNNDLKAWAIENKREIK